MNAHASARCERSTGFSQVGDRIVIVGATASSPRPTDHAELAISTDCASVSAQRNFYRGSWFDALEVYWRDISGGGRLKDRAYDSPAVHRMTGSSAVVEHSTLAMHVRVPPGESRTVRAAI